jgi:hypothetical protein
MRTGCGGSVAFSPEVNYVLKATEYFVTYVLLMYSLTEPIRDVQREFLKSSCSFIICYQMVYVKSFIQSSLWDGRIT